MFRTQDRMELSFMRDAVVYGGIDRAVVNWVRTESAPSMDAHREKASKPAMMQDEPATRQSEWSRPPHGK